MSRRRPTMDGPRPWACLVYCGTGHPNHKVTTLSLTSKGAVTISGGGQRARVGGRRMPVRVVTERRPDGVVVPRLPCLLCSENITCTWENLERVAARLRADGKSRVSLRVLRDHLADPAL